MQLCFGTSTLLERIPAASWERILPVCHTTCCLFLHKSLWGSEKIY